MDDNNNNDSPIRDNFDALTRTLVLAVTARTDALAAEAMDVTTAMTLADAELAMLVGGEA